MTSLPIDNFLPAITDALAKHRALVLVAEPGAGKTTRVPPAILRAKLLNDEHPKMVMLQPRRIAARASAERIAEENHWRLGEEVGYQVRFENRTSARTKLRVVTEAILTRQLLDDPSLEGLGCVILDEFHERSIHSDMAIALLRQAKEALRDDLMLVVMSATLNAEEVSAFLRGAPIIRVPGRTFPVDISYKPRGADLEQTVARVVSDELSSPGHVLVFLPGAAEIQRAQEALSAVAQRDGSAVLPLYGALPFEQQQRAIAPSAQRKIVLATNIAETSLTIDGVRTVIDAGLARVPRFDPQRGLDELTLQRISRASADQRAGRAGRTAAGRCVRLWTQLEHQQLADFDSPEIASVDLARTLLDVHAWGENDVDHFDWFEKPPHDSLTAAEDVLRQLGALSDEGFITPLGKRMQSLPVHPRLARLLIGAADAGATRMGATIAALLAEKDFVQRQYNDRRAIGSNRTISESDVLLRLHLFDAAERSRFPRGAAGDNVDVFAAEQIARARDQFARAIGQGAARATVDEETLVRQLVLMAYPDRVTKRRAGDPTAGIMNGGVGVRLDPDSSVIAGDYFVSVDPRQDDRSRFREATVRIASTIEPEWLETFFPQSIHKLRTPVYDADRGRVVVKVETRYLDLVLREVVDLNIDKAEAPALLAAALQPLLPEMIEQSEPLSALIARLRFLKLHFPDRDWPTPEGNAWRELLIEACQGKQSREQVQRALVDTLRNRLAYPLDRLLDEHAPEAITVPTGSRINLAYNTDPKQPPVLAVRLQEMFGLPDTPRIAGGRVPVLLHLLGPNFRPVQVTQDLSSFWKNTYAQVRKDLRARYPKQSWPDDPLTADPIRGAKRRRPEG